MNGILRGTTPDFTIRVKTQDFLTFITIKCRLKNQLHKGEINDYKDYGYYVSSS